MSAPKKKPNLQTKRIKELEREMEAAQARIFALEHAVAQLAEGAGIAFYPGDPE